MENIAINQIEELYKDEINSHNIKKSKKNIGIKSFKSIELKYKKNMSNKFSYKTRLNKLISQSIGDNKNTEKNDSVNFNLYMQKDQNDSSFFCNNEYKREKEEEEKKKNSPIQTKKVIKLKTCNSFRNCGGNINNAQLLLFNKENNNNKENIKQTNKIGIHKIRSLFQNSKKYKKPKYKDLDKDSIIKNEYEICSPKRKITKNRGSRSNNKLLIIPKSFNIQSPEEEKDENSKKNLDNKNERYNEVISSNNLIPIRKNMKTNFQFKCSNSNEIKKTKMNNSPSKFKFDNIGDKNKKINKNNELENSKKLIFTQSPIKYKNKNNNNDNGSKNDKLINNLEISSNFNSISIKKREKNKNNLNNKNNNKNDEESFSSSFTYKNKFKIISPQKIISFIYNDNKNKEKENKEINSNINNKIDNKKIINNININCYKTMEKNDNELEKEKENDKVNLKNESFADNIKNILNNSVEKKSCNSFFRCCFLLK